MATTFLVASFTTELFEQMISVSVKNTISAARTASSHGPLLPARKQRPRLAHDSALRGGQVARTGSMLEWSITPPAGDAPSPVAELQTGKLTFGEATATFR